MNISKTIAVQVLGLLLLITAGVTYTNPAHADALDKILSSGVLKCGVMLDYPPLGFYDDQHKPAGYSVDWCKDMAEKLGVELEIVPTPSAQRIPALVSGHVDVSVSNASNTLERAKTVLFSIPYYVAPVYAVTTKDSGIKSFDDFKGKTIGDVRGSRPAILFAEYNKSHWNGASTLKLYGNDAAKVLALRQGKIQGFTVNLPTAKRLVKKFPNFVLIGKAPYKPDTTSMMVRRGEFGLLHWVNLFIYQEVRHGRYKEIWNKWLGAGDLQPPSLTVPGVYY